MSKMKKTAILLVCTLLVTGCATQNTLLSENFLMPDNTLTRSKIDIFKNLEPVALTDEQYRKLLENELDIDMDSTEYKVRSGFYSNEDVFHGGFYLEDISVTWPRSFSVINDDIRKYGYINQDSDVVIEPKYKSASNFHNGIANIEFLIPDTTTPDIPLSDFEKDYYNTVSVYIDETGDINEKLSKYTGSTFLDGTATVQKRKKASSFFEISPDGKKLYGGKKNVTRTDFTGNKLGTISIIHLNRNDEEYNILFDESGEILINSDQKFVDFQGAGDNYVYGFKNFSDKYVSYEDNRDKYDSNSVKFGVLDTKGNVVSGWLDFNIKTGLLMDKYMFDSEVNDDLILIYDTDTKKFGYLSTTGKIAIEPTYTCATRFSEGLACVSDGENYGFVNTDGELVVPMKYPILDNHELRFDNEYYAVWIDPDILTYLEPLFQYSKFKEGVCPVRENGKFGLINKNGDYVVAPIFDELSNVNDGIATGRIGNNYYVIEKINK